MFLASLGLNPSYHASYYASKSPYYECKISHTLQVTKSKNLRSGKQQLTNPCLLQPLQNKLKTLNPVYNMTTLPVSHQRRVSKIIGHLQSNPTSAESEYVQQYREKLRQLRQELAEFIDKINCNPILVRLGIICIIIQCILLFSCMKHNVTISLLRHHSNKLIE